MKAILTRIGHSKTQTLGELDVFSDSNKLLFSCKTLELEEDINAVRDDAIPKGVYTVVPRYSEKYNNHYQVTNVPNRSYILIHPANYSRQLLGCIAVGKAHIDIDGDGLKDVTSSKATMAELLKVAPEGFELTIL